MKLTLKQIFKQIYLSFAWIGVLIVIVDQISKHLAASSQVDVVIIKNFFKFEYTRNKGAAWSILADHPILLAVISFVAGMAMIAFYMYQFKKINTMFKISLMLMIGGTWGNFIDRAFYRDGVIDFIRFDLFGYHYPTFNIADMSLVIGSIMLIVYLLFFEGKADEHPSH